MLTKVTIEYFFFLKKKESIRINLNSRRRKFLYQACLENGNSESAPLKRWPDPNILGKATARIHLKKNVNINNVKIDFKEEKCGKLRLCLFYFIIFFV